MTLRSTRRAALAGLAAFVVAPRPVRAAVAPLRDLTLWGPPAGPSITVAHAAATGMLAAVADKVTFKAWRNPDELRAGLTSGTLLASVMPTASAANLFNRGLGVRLLNIMTDGLLHVIATDPGLDRIEKLKGRTIAVPFRNDTPEFALQRLLKTLDMAPGRDLTVETTGTPIEAIQMVAAGRIDAALVPEPAASAAIVRAAAMGKTVVRAMDFQAEWARLTGNPPDLPQAGMAVTDAFLKAHPEHVDLLHEALAKATAAALAAPAVAAGSAAATLELPWPVIEKAIPHSRLVCTRAREARPSLERLFKTVAEYEPNVIGGRLPDAGFYL